MTTVAANMLASSDVGPVHGGPSAKEARPLPTPATTPGDQLDHAGVGQRLAWLLQYLNPFFYARMAQSLVSSVLESYQVSSSDNGTGHASRQISVPVPADATAIDCGYMDVAGRGTHGSQLSSLPQLDLDPTLLPIGPLAAAAGAHEHSVSQAAGEPARATATDGSGPTAASADPRASKDAAEAAETTNAAEKAEEAAGELPGEPMAVSAADPATPPADGSPKRKSSKKGKRGKAKTRSRSRDD